MLRLCAYSVAFNSEFQSVANLLKKLAFAGIKMNLIELQSCELFQELALAGIKVNGSEENAHNSF